MSLPFNMFCVKCPYLFNGFWEKHPYLWMYLWKPSQPMFVFTKLVLFIFCKHLVSIMATQTLTKLEFKPSNLDTTIETENKTVQWIFNNNNKKIATIAIHNQFCKGNCASVSFLREEEPKKWPDHFTLCLFKIKVSPSVHLMMEPTADGRKDVLYDERWK